MFVRYLALCLACKRFSINVKAAHQVVIIFGMEVKQSTEYGLLLYLWDVSVTLTVTILVCVRKMFFTFVIKYDILEVLDMTGSTFRRVCCWKEVRCWLRFISEIHNLSFK